jgi:integrase
MSKKPWPRIKAVIKNDKPMILVDARIGAKGERRFFENKAAAQGWAELCRVARKNEGNSAFKLSAQSRADAGVALKLLAPINVTLQEAAKFYLRHAVTATGDKTIHEVINELLHVKKAANLSPRYLEDLRCRLGIFARTFGAEKVIDVSQQQVDDWLIALPYGAVTKNNFRCLVGVFFNYAKDRKYVLDVPISKQSKVAIKRGKPGILTVEECSRLLSAADDEILPALALGLFAGLRPESEIWRLDWSKIDFVRKQIDIEPLATKNTGDNASVRWVDMSDNLIEWLLPHRKAKGPVWSMVRDTFYRAIEKARTAAGIATWPHDCLRHCFCSYHYAAHNDAGLTMAQAGHTNPRTFFRHYRARVQTDDARRFFQIRPVAGEGGDKILAIA